MKPDGLYLTTVSAPNWFVVHKKPRRQRPFVLLVLFVAKID
jgi:hypothetical protein